MAYGMAGKSPKGINSGITNWMGSGKANNAEQPRTGGPLMMDPNINPNTGMPYKRTIEELQAMQQSGQQLKPIQQRRLENYQMPEPVQTQPFPMNPVQRPTFPGYGNRPFMPPMNQDPRFANIKSLPQMMDINDPRLAQVRPYFTNKIQSLPELIDRNDPRSLPELLNMNDPRLAQVRPYFTNSPLYKK